MRAVVCNHYGPIEDLVLEEVDDLSPGSNEILIEVHAAGINFPDLLIVQGKYQARPPLPFVPGSECAGTVLAVGDGVERVGVGDPVIATCLSGAFAERLVVRETDVLAVPRGVSLEVAAGVAITYGTSYYALKQRAGLARGETLLVLGAAGGVGLAAVELGKRLGATVIAAASSADKLAVAAAAGADHGIDYSTERLKDRVKELTDGRGADVIYDPVGGELSEQAFRSSAWQGRHLVVGFASGEIPKIPLNLALLKGASLVGVFWGSFTEREPAAAADNVRELAAMFEAGELEPKITPYPLDDFAQALTALAERRSVGKLVLTMGPSRGR